MTRARVRSLTLMVASVVVAAACTSGGAQVSGGAPASPSPTTSSGAPTAASAEPSSSAVGVPAPAGLLKAGELSACIDATDAYPPLEYTDVAGNLIGFDPEAFQAVAKHWGLVPKVVNTTFDGLIPGLEAGRCDLVWSGLYLSDKRLAVADGIPELATGQVVLVTAGNPAGIKTVADICGKKIAIQSGGIVEQTITGQSQACTAAGKPAIAIQAYKTVPDEFQQIILGRVDGVQETDIGAAGFMLKNPGKYEIGYAFPKTDKFGVYMGKGKTEIKGALAEALRVLKADGTLLALAKKLQLDPATLDVIQ